MGVRGVRLRLSSLGGAQARREYRERLQSHLRAHRDALSQDVADRIELNPLRALDADPEPTSREVETAPRPPVHLNALHADHFPCLQDLLPQTCSALAADS